MAYQLLVEQLSVSEASGEYTSGVVNFQSINPDRTRVTLELAYAPKGFIVTPATQLAGIATNRE